MQNKLKQTKKNVFSFTQKLFIVLTTFATLFTLNWYNNNYNNNCLFAILCSHFCPCKHQQLLGRLYFARNLSSHKSDWIITDRYPLCLAFLYTHAFTLQNFLEVEGSNFRLRENSIVTDCICAFSYSSSTHPCCC